MLNETLHHHLALAVWYVIKERMLAVGGEVHLGSTTLPILWIRAAIQALFSQTVQTRPLRLSTLTVSAFAVPTSQRRKMLLLVLLQGTSLSHRILCILYLLYCLPCQIFNSLLLYHLSSTGSYLELSASWKHVDTGISTNYTRRRLETVANDGSGFEVL